MDAEELRARLTKIGTDSYARGGLDVFDTLIEAVQNSPAMPSEVTFLLVGARSAWIIANGDPNA